MKKHTIKYQCPKCGAMYANRCRCECGCMVERIDEKSPEFAAWKKTNDWAANIFGMRG